MFKNKYKYNLTVLIFFSVILSLTLSGCAGSGKTRASLGKITERSVKINGKRYVSVFEICKNQNISYDWDGFSNIITLKKEGIQIKLCLGSSLILYADQVHDLESPVRVYNGLIMAPDSFVKFFLIEKEIIPPKEAKPGIFKIKKIVIDAGHGGKDPGAVGKSGIKEKDIVLDLAQRLGKELKKQGINVVLTRNTDIFHSLQKRSQIANEENADFFISIHANAAQTSSAQGFEAYYLSVDHDDFSKAVQIRENAAIKFEDNTEYQYSTDLNATLWDMILSENRIESIKMAKFVADELKRNLKLNTRYIKGANFYVLKGAKMPAVLLEAGYLTNSQEAARLNNAYYRQMLAEAISSGIIKYKRTFELNNGFSR
ncbi:MAG: N-acetylmuramoyl-L-alanine amidase [Candidatus Omnitrophota bacterium]